jgi:hypothetical protein
MEHVIVPGCNISCGKCKKKKYKCNSAFYKDVFAASMDLLSNVDVSDELYRRVYQILLIVVRVGLAFI